MFQVKRWRAQDEGGDDEEGKSISLAIIEKKKEILVSPKCKKAKKKSKEKKKKKKRKRELEPENDENDNILETEEKSDEGNSPAQNTANKEYASDKLSKKTKKKKEKEKSSKNAESGVKDSELSKPTKMMTGEKKAKKRKTQESDASLAPSSMPSTEPPTSPVSPVKHKSMNHEAIKDTSKSPPSKENDDGFSGEKTAETAQPQNEDKKGKNRTLGGRKDNEGGRASINLEGEGIDVEAAGLNDRIVGAARTAGIQKLFPVQAAVVPLALQCYEEHDLCVSAPTGSGKTLAYALPVLNALESRAVCRLRALVMVPTRDLAIQVYSVFQRFAPSLGLSISTCIGQRSFHAEQMALSPIGNSSSSSWRIASSAPSSSSASSHDGRSGVDVLIATPGRLIDHLDSTPGFTLEYLQFLVIDEADRLLGQNYQGWVPRVLDAAYPKSSSSLYSSGRRGLGMRSTAYTNAKFIAAGTYAVPMQTLLFSATLAKDPMKMAQLRLRNPLFLTATSGENSMHEFRTPEGLEERLVICRKNEKALVLLHLLLWLRATEEEKRQQRLDTADKDDGHGENGGGGEGMSPCKQIIIFASTKDATHRVCRLLESSQLIQPPPVEFSAALPQNRRNAVVRRMKKGSIHTLICSDAMARGMDVTGVDCVINYDAPTHIRTYIHRVGRTARAGRTGHAFTICEPGQVGPFKAILRRAQNGYVARHNIDRESQLDPLVPKFQSCLLTLKSVLEREARGIFDPVRPIDSKQLLIVEREISNAGGQEEGLMDLDEEDGGSDDSEEEEEEEEEGAANNQDDSDDNENDEEGEDNEGVKNVSESNDDDDDDDDEDSNDDNNNEEEEEEDDDEGDKNHLRASQGKENSDKFHQRWTRVPSLRETVRLLATADIVS